MKRILTAALLMMFATSAFAADTKKPPMKSDEAIMKTAEAFFDAWNKHDAKTMATARGIVPRRAQAAVVRRILGIHRWKP